MKASEPGQEAEDAAVGGRLRALRTGRRLTLAQVADRAGVSEGFLSQIERNVANASIGTLRRIATALGVAMSDLFAAEFDPGPRVLRVADRPALDFGVLARKYLLSPRPHRDLEVFLVEFEPGGSTGEDPYTHGDSEEFVIVLEGGITLHLGPAAHRLGTGDCIDFRSSVPHRLIEDGGAPARVLWAISPPGH